MSMASISQGRPIDSRCSRSTTDTSTRVWSICTMSNGKSARSVEIPTQTQPISRSLGSFPFLHGQPPIEGRYPPPVCLIVGGREAEFSEAPLDFPNEGGHRGPFRGQADQGFALNRSIPITVRCGLPLSPLLHLNRFWRTFGAAEPAKPLVSRLMKYFSDRLVGDPPRVWFA